MTIKSFLSTPSLVLIVSTVIIAVSGYFFYESEENRIRQRQYTELKAIADLKVQQIVQWNHDRRSDAAVISKSDVFTQTVESWLSDKTVRSIEKSIRQRLEAVVDYLGYIEIALISQSGELLLSVGKQHERLEAIVLEKLRSAAQSREITFTDLHRCTSDEAIHYDIIAPIVNSEDKAIAHLLFRRDPSQFLYPLIQSWPTPSKSAETFIVRREGEYVLFLNEARHKKNTALKLRVPVTDTQFPAVVTALGFEGMVKGTDYRGVPVLASVQHIPGTSWKMIAKVDTDEIFADLTTAAMVVSGITLLLILLVGTGVSFVYSHRQKGIYQELYTKEKELWQAQEKFKVTLDSLGDGVIITDTKGTISYLNKQAERLTRWQLREARGRHLSEVYRVRNEETGRVENNIVEKVLMGGIVKELANHTILISRDGTEAPMMDTGAPIYDIDSSIIGLVITFQDETEKRTQQRLLKESEQKLRLTLDNAGEGIYGIDREGNATFVNEAAARILGYTPDELVGKQMHTNHHYHRQDGSPYDLEDCPIYKTFTEGKRYHIETEVFWRKDGTAIPVQYTSTPIQENGNVLGAVVVFEDIRERKLTEEKIRQLNLELEERVRERTALLEAANNDLEAFSYSVSHDLRAPLRHIQGYVDLLERTSIDALNEKGQRYLRIIRQVSGEMGGLIDGLLDFSRMGRREMRTMKVDMDILVHATIEKLETEMSGRNISWEIQALPAVEGDAAMIKQVLVNLIGNAVKYSRGRDPAIIQLACNGEDDGYHVFFVRDNGVGFDPRYAHKLFGVFERLHRPDEFEGTGIGLAIVRRIISRHGGRTWAEGKPDEGASFYFTLKAFNETQHEENDE